MNTKDLKKASTSYLIGSLFNKGIAFFTVPIFTRLLSTSDYGIVNTYNSWIAILAMVVGFALHTGIRIAFIDYKDGMEDFLATTTTFTLLSGGILAAIIYLIASLVSVSISSALIILCLFQSISSALIEDYSMYLMMQYRYKFRTALMVLPNLISVMLSVIAIKFFLTDNLYLGRIIPTSSTVIFFGIIVCVLVYSKSRCFFNKEYLKYALTFSLPLVLHGIALNILSQSDRTMITWLADSSQTGIYSLIYNFSMIATVITTSLEGIWIPWFYKKLQVGKTEEINTIAKDYINLMTYCLIGVIMVGPEVVKILASSNYWDGIKIIPPVVISNFVIFAYSLYVNIEHYHKKTKGITVNTVIAAITNIILNYLLIPKFGYVAAAFTTLVSYLVSFILHAFKSKKLEPELYPITYFILPLCEVCIATVLFYMFMDNAIIRWGVVLVFVIAMFFKEWKRIIVYFPRLDRKKS
ncbi:oligosaccharide flippase family protein [Acetobacterium woodii]|uniref:oligosaccharide flippase family protein n=1 Tax=Acetobacterium woodii TaxID=33952 RepID=UPI0002EE6F5C|nr:oligosaccharide flippase family protein [Acetobacterium woodii]